MGDLKYGRAVHSLCKILSFYSNVKLNLISPKELKLPPELLNQLNEAGLNLSETENLEDGISEVDIIYVTRIQEERFKSKSDANKYRGLLSLNQSIYTANCEPNTVIMHPLPRDSRSDANELDRDLYENPNLAIFRQADNGVVIRMAMFALVLGVEGKIEESSKEVVQNFDNYMSNMAINDAIEEVLQFVRSINKYFEHSVPWKVVKEDKELAGTILYTGAEALRISAVLLSSIMPERTKKLFQVLNTDSRDRKWGGLKSGIKLGTLSALFPRIDSQHK